MRRGQRILVAAVVAVGASPTACSRGQQPGPTARTEPPALDALDPAAPSSAASRWVPVRRAAGISLLELPARVLPSPLGAGAVTIPYPGRVTRVLVQAGQQVERGAPIVEAVMPAIADAAGHFVAAETRLGAHAAHRRQLEALRAEGLAKVSELAQASVDEAEARADQRAALAVLRSAGLSEAEATRAAETGGAVVLRSPIRGTVVELDAVVGEAREPAGRPLARVAAKGTGRIEARLSSELPDGARFELVMPDGSSRRLTMLGRGPAVDPRDGTVPAWFELVTPGPLPAGLGGRLRVSLPEALRAVVVPARAVETRDGGTFVLVRRDGRTVSMPVRVLARSGADAVVEGPLQVGEEVAADAREAGAAAGEAVW